MRAEERFQTNDRARLKDNVFVLGRTIRAGTIVTVERARGALVCVWEEDRGLGFEVNADELEELPAWRRRSWTVEEIREANEAAGFKFFVFKGRLHSGVFQGPGGVFFVTSEYQPHGPRQYQVRQFLPESAHVVTPEHHQHYSSGARARTAAKIASWGPFVPGAIVEAARVLGPYAGPERTALRITEGWNRRELHAVVLHGKWAGQVFALDWDDVRLPTDTARFVLELAGTNRQALARHLRQLADAVANGYDDGDGWHLRWNGDETPAPAPEEAPC